MIRSFPLPIILLLAACGGAAPKKEPPPAKTEAVVHETDLLRISLTAQAQKRLGIVTTRVGAGEAARMRETSGEIVVPSIAGGVPTGSTSNLAQIGVAQAAADGEVERTQAQAHLARKVTLLPLFALDKR